jgi:hypothetical protein
MRQWMARALWPWLCLGQHAVAQAFKPAVDPLIRSVCIECHDADTRTGLNLEILGHDLSDPAVFRQWEKVYDQVRTGKMPPAKKPRPDPEQVRTAMQSLRQDLHAVSRAGQVLNGRVAIRRLTPAEYEYTLHDLLGIGGALAKQLPPENASARFDTVAAAQGMSPVHVRSYLAAADLALDEAIVLGVRPPKQPRLIDYLNAPYVAMWFERSLRRGGDTVKKADNAFVTFEAREHPTRSDHIGYRPPYAGRYLIKAEAYAYQARTPVTLMIMRASEEQGGAALVGVFDLVPGRSRNLSLVTYLTPDDYFYLSTADLDWDKNGRNIYHRTTGGAKKYTGEGVAVKWLTVQGPLENQWPPARTRNLLHGLEFVSKRKGYEPQITRPLLEHVTEIVEHLGSRAIRRPMKADEVSAFVRLARPAIAAGDFDRGLRMALRGLLSSPQFIYHAGEPGRLDDHALAARLSYFLWKSLPDKALSRLADEGRLSDPQTLSGQVDRMLNHDKATRFIRDFAGQWLDLDEIDATTPDDKLYPEYDDILRQAMLRETEGFLRHMIQANLPARNLVDADFTFLNRRLAEHYGIPGIVGEHFRKVSLPVDSVRGGVLTQAGILKVTANGTVSSPVKRGAFVLAKLLGQAPGSPPPDAGTVDPDTRGTTTIREILDAHRNVEKCARCHREIDPPGFALECFDPVGGFRTRYRSTQKGLPSRRRLFGRPIWEYREGPLVDTSGVTAEGQAFTGIRDFKRHLLGKVDVLGRNLLENLVVYSTGGEIQFADREELDTIAAGLKKEAYPLRSMIHRVVQSRLFRDK